MIDRLRYMPWLSKDEEELVRLNWPAYYENPSLFADTDLRDIVDKWAREKAARTNKGGTT